MRRLEETSGRTGRALAALLALVTLAGLLVTTSKSEAADDIDLLRERGGTPFVMVLVDTSASMNTSPPRSNKNADLGSWVPANGDDPGSKIFQVKRALYEVFSQVENVHFGFAGFNQDHLHVKEKHWLYRAGSPASFFAQPLTIAYPSAAGETWTFGAHFDLPTGTPGVAGSCAAPLSYSNDRNKLDRFARLGSGGQGTTTLWIVNKGRTYRITVERSANATITDPADPEVTVPNGVGNEFLEVEITAELIASCAPLQVDLIESQTVLFRKVTDFLMVEADVGEQGTPATIGPESIDTRQCAGEEYIAGFWDYQDPVADGTCGAGSGRPFTGRGWEGNTDAGERAGFDDLDPFCSGPDCYNLRFPTVLDPRFPELDFGDFIPLDWDVEYREEFLKRLNPRHPDYDADTPEEYFGIARFFRDRPDPGASHLELRNEDERPLVAFGNTPLARAINDFRCWVLGDDGNKCKGPQYESGWNTLFEDNDLWYHCRVPYLIVISDGEDNSKGENPTADPSDFQQAAGVRTFAFTFRDTAQLKSMANAGGGELILVGSGDELKTELLRIIGQIEQEARTFATAAVPSVQATTQQNIYVTDFTPLNERAVWEGRVRSFRVTDDLDLNDDTPNWDAATAILAQAPEPAADGDNSSVDLQLGTAADDRRVYYVLERNPEVPALDSWADNRRLFDRTGPEPGAATPTAPVEPDLWDGLGITYDASDPSSVRRARARAHRIVEDTLLEKTWEDPDRGTVRYVLGEIFHSDPLIVGGPNNIRYFVQDAEEIRVDGVEQGTGYREYFAKHENRRQVLLAGANDGMLHAWDAGKADLETFVDDFGIERTEVRYDNGSGVELFAFVPRSVLPTVSQMAENPFAHRWSVDGTVAAGDVFLDPQHDGTPTPEDRSWRTVLVGGLREGGSGYYALDITHPDELREEVVGPLDSAGAQRRVFLPTDRDVVPDCADATGSGDLACDPDVKYPAPLWEFTDSVWDPVADEHVFLDEDDPDRDGVQNGDGLRDLAETWSSADIGRIKVIENGDTVNKYVAVFGGGLDPAKGETRGDWLYIVDIETGTAIYKRQLEGSAPAAPAAVDVNQDGFFDVVYQGTTAGFMYRLDLVERTSDGDEVLPKLTSQIVRGINGLSYPVVRIEKGTDSNAPLWAPKKIFTTEGRPIYFPPAVLFVGDLGKFALGFGTGDRDDLTSLDAADGRFYLFVDESAEIDPAALPMAQDRFTEITLDEADNPNLLTDESIPVGQRGWFLVLRSSERLIGTPFGFAGLTFFATFTSDDPREDTETCDVRKSNCDNPNCRLTGISRIYLVGTTDADAFLEVDGIAQRYREIQGFVTNPFTEQGVTIGSGGNGGGGGGGGEEEEGKAACPDLTPKLRDIFPEQCKFANHRERVNFIPTDAPDVECLAQVPVCIIERNWKEVSE